MMKSPEPRHILLCVAGMTPQIITETLYALIRKNNERVDEIRVITTLAGRNRILKDLLDRNDGEFFNFCRDFKIDPKKISFDESTISLLYSPNGHPLEDIRAEEENQHAANQICEIVRGLTEDQNTRIHASVAGGRKTMSIYLTVAMQLFGRNQDRLSHVLVSESFETHPQFFYIPPAPRELEIKDRATGEVRRISTEQAQIHLAGIPFIRLRGIIADWLSEGGNSYSDLVRRAQTDLDLLESAHDLRFDLRNRTVFVADRAVKLHEREFFIYLLFAWLRKRRRKGKEMIGVNEIKRGDLDKVFRLVTKARGEEIGLEECESYPRFEFLAKLAARIESHNQIDADDLRTTFGETRSKINRKLESAGLPEHYLLNSQGERGLLSYGLQLPPERLIWK